MTVLLGAARYARAGRLLWRDTGRHVLILPPNTGGEVLSIGGGAAAVWRLLDKPRSVTELCQSFAGDGNEAPEESLLVACLEQLGLHGLVEHLRDER